MLLDTLLSFEGLSQYLEAIEECEAEGQMLEGEVEEGYESKLIATLTFRRPPLRRDVSVLLHHWVEGASKSRGCDWPDWFAVIEYGRGDKEIRIYCRIAASQLFSKEYLSLRWRELGGGNVSISDYRPGLLCRTVLKMARAASRFQIAMYREGMAPEDWVHAERTIERVMNE